MSRGSLDIGRELKSIGDSYIESHPASLPVVREGIERRMHKRSWLVMGGAALVTGAAALLIYFASSSSAPDETLPPAAGELSIVQEVELAGSPLQVAARDDAAWVTRRDEGQISRVEAGEDAVASAKKLGMIPTDIVATEGALWLADPQHNRVVQVDPETLEQVRSWQLSGAPDRLTVGAGAIRVTVEGVGVVRIDLKTDAVETLYEGSVLDVAMGQHAFWILDSGGRVFAIDPDTGVLAEGFDSQALIGEGEITYLKNAIYYSAEGYGTLVRIDEATGAETARIELPGPYQDIDADSDGLWLLVRDGRLGRLIELDPATGEPTALSLTLPDDPIDIVTGADGVWVALGSGGRIVLVR